jgi:hypothetical protein
MVSFVPSREAAFPYDDERGRQNRTTFGNFFTRWERVFAAAYSIGSSQHPKDFLELRAHRQVQPAVIG